MVEGLWQSFVLAFVPLFIVIDALGNLPFVISLSEGMIRHERRKMIHVAMITAAIVGLAFLFLGQAVLRIMNISVGTSRVYRCRAIKLLSTWMAQRDKD